MQLNMDYSNKHTNNTSMNILDIDQYIHQREHLYLDIPTATLREAFSIILQNNVFRVGNIYCLQKQGKAMCTPSAPTYANLSFIIYENHILSRKFTNLLVYKHDINNIFGIWTQPDNAIKDKTQRGKFENDINNYHGLTWIFSPWTK